jgi:hypothetical protein
MPDSVVAWLVVEGGLTTAEATAVVSFVGRLVLAVAISNVLPAATRPRDSSPAGSASR